MGTFVTKKVLNGNPSLIPSMAEQIRSAFEADGFKTQVDNLLGGGAEVSVAKGGIFKAVLGMKTALKVSLIPTGNSIAFEAGIGIFGQQAIPTVITMLIFWPVVIMQIWGMVKQSQLDDKALEIAESFLRGDSSYTVVEPTDSSTVFCSSCGHANPQGAKFCSTCGHPL